MQVEADARTDDDERYDENSRQDAASPNLAPCGLALKLAAAPSRTG